MKVTILIAIAAIVWNIQGVQPLFFGMNVIYPLASRMATECLKASAVIEVLPLKITQILKTTAKFKSNEFKVASESFLDMQHFYNGLFSFLHQYSTLLNEPPAISTHNTFSQLIYNARLMESATLQIASASRTFSAVFGPNMKDAMELILRKYSEMITVVRACLEILKLNFESILNADRAVTVEVLDAELDMEAISDILIAFQEITLTSKQMVFIFSGIIEITKTLESATSTVSFTAQTAKSSFSTLNFVLSNEVQSAKLTLIDEIQSNIHTIVKSFTDYSHSSLQIFSNTTTPTFLTFLQNQQSSIHDFTSQVTELFSSIQNEFATQLNEYYSAIYQTIKENEDTVTNSAVEIENYLAQLVVNHSGSSFKNCFDGDREVKRQAAMLIETMQFQFSECVVSERTLSNQLESLLTFVVEDITLNMQGVSDKLCECSVKGGEKVQERTKECLMKITTDLHSTVINDDVSYLHSELDNIDRILQRSITRFENCSGNVTEAYAINFETFQQAALACMVST